MIKIDKKEWDKLKPEEKIAHCEGLLEDARGSREKKDLEWYLNYMFSEGNHYLTYNTTTQSLETNPPRRKGEVRMVVNKVRSSKRAIQNYVTGSRPKWEVTPGDTDEESVGAARKYGKVLDYIYRRLHLESMVSGVVDQALDTSVGIVELDWDEDAENGQGQVLVKNHDAFEVFIDKRAYIYAGRLVSRFVAKTVNKSLDEIANDGRYDEKTRTKVKEDDEPAVSRLKAKIIRREQGADDKKIKRATVKEFMLWDDEGNDKKGKIQLFTYAGKEVLRDEPLPARKYNIYFCQVSMNPLRVYQRSWTADAVPLNKALDRSISQKITYINKALKYTIIAEKGHGAGISSNEMGEILEINKGRTYQQMQVQPLPAGFDRLDQEISTYIEDIMGAHDAALGRLPSGARSGKTLEALQAADANNLTGLTQALESFLAVLGEDILDIVAEKYVASRVMRIAEPEDGSETIKVQGEKGKLGKDRALTIKGENEVMVKIGSWLGYTKEAQIDTIMRLSEIGVLPREEVLRHLEFPNVEELSKKAQEQALEKHRLDAEIAGRNQQAQQGQQGPDVNAQMKDMADKENMAIMNGQEIPPTEGANMVHTQTHLDFMKTGTFSSADPRVQAGLAQHVKGELIQQGVIGGDQGSQVPVPQQVQQ